MVIHHHLVSFATAFIISYVLPNFSPHYAGGDRAAKEFRRKTFVQPFTCPFPKLVWINRGQIADSPKISLVCKQPSRRTFCIVSFSSVWVIQAACISDCTFQNCPPKSVI